MIILTNDPRKLEWILKDDRERSDILEQAVKHYSRYQQTKDPGERFAYLVEMYSLMEQMEVASHLLKDMSSKIVAQNIFETMRRSLAGNKDFDDYSLNQLGSLAYLLGQIERPEEERDTIGCMKKLNEFKSGIR